MADAHVLLDPREDTQQASLVMTKPESSVGPPVGLSVISDSSTFVESVPDVLDDVDDASAKSALSDGDRPSVDASVNPENSSLGAIGPPGPPPGLAQPLGYAPFSSELFTQFPPLPVQPGDRSGYPVVHGPATYSMPMPMHVKAPDITKPSIFEPNTMRLQRGDLFTGALGSRDVQDTQAADLPAYLNPYSFSFLDDYGKPPMPVRSVFPQQSGYVAGTWDYGRMPPGLFRTGGTPVQTNASISERFLGTSPFSWAPMRGSGPAVACPKDSSSLMKGHVAIDYPSCQWHESVAAVGEISGDGHIFTKRAGPRQLRKSQQGHTYELATICMVFDATLRSGGVHRYQYHILSGDLGPADGAGFTFDSKVRRKSIQQMCAVFLNQRGVICLRRRQNVTKLPARLPPLTVGMLLTITVDLDACKAHFEASQQGVTTGSADVSLKGLVEETPNFESLRSGFFCAVVTGNISVGLY